MFILIIGGGKVGFYLAQMLLKEGAKVRMIENRERRVAAIRRELPADIVIHGSGTDPILLEQSGILDANVVVAVTGQDETNLVVTNLARLEFGVARTIARVNNPKNVWMFTKQMGVDVAVNQADLIAHLIQEEMALGDMITLLKLHGGEYSLVEEKLHPTSLAVDKAISELGLPEESVITAIIRNDRLILPRGNVILREDDEILAMVHSTSLAAFEHILGIVKQ